MAACSQTNIPILNTQEDPCNGIHSSTDCLYYPNEIPYLFIGLQDSFTEVVQAMVLSLQSNNTRIGQLESQNSQTDNLNLQQVTDEGNTTTNDVEFNDGAKILFDNGSRLQKGTTNSQTGGNGGISQVCSIDYELKWEAGRQYVMQQDGFTIREVSHNFTFTPGVNDDSTMGFVPDSRWILDNGDIYLCIDNTEGDAVWELQVPADSRPYKVYTALLSQTGTSAPVATVLENTIGNIVWTRNSIGDYSGTLASNSFIFNKTFLMLHLPAFSIGHNITTFFKRMSDNSLSLITLFDGNRKDLLGDTSVEIRVYN